MKSSALLVEERWTLAGPPAAAPAHSVSAVCSGGRPAPGRTVLAAMSVFVWLAYSRSVEFIPFSGLLFLLGAALLGYAVMSNRISALQAGPTWVFAALTVLMVISGMLGLWPGGSLSVVKDLWRGSLLIYLVVVCLTTDLMGIRRVIGTIAWSVVTIAVLGLVAAGEVEGRLVIGTQTLGNPNDLATFLAVGLPFCASYSADSSRGWVRRLAVVLACPLVCVMILRTGSRAALLALGVLGLGLMAAASWRIRVLMVALAVAGLTAAPLVLPPEIQGRYLTLFSQQPGTVGGSRQAEFAAGSSQARLKILLRSLRTAIENPLFGVGPGNFAIANAEMTSDAGMRADWHQTHNAYTQVLSECGILAGFLFSGLVLHCLVSPGRWRKLAGREPALRPHVAMPMCIQGAMVVYAVCAMFSNIAYQIHLPLLAALVVASGRVFRREMEEAAATKATGLPQGAA